jgi:hypothetical protein
LILLIGVIILCRKEASAWLPFSETRVPAKSVLASAAFLSLAKESTY